MKLQTAALVLGILASVGCDDGGGPLAPSPVILEPESPSSAYVAVHRGRCPSDADLPFSVRENGWFWPDTCRNNHGEIIQLSDWCSGTRRVDRDSCVLNSPDPPTPPPPTSSDLSVTGPMSTVLDGACVEYVIGGGTPPYRLASRGGRWMTSSPCRGITPTRYTLPAPGVAVWSATGLDAGDSATVTVTDADGARKIFTLAVV